MTGRKKQVKKRSWRSETRQKKKKGKWEHKGRKEGRKGTRRKGYSGVGAAIQTI